MGRTRASALVLARGDIGLICLTKLASAGKGKRGLGLSQTCWRRRRARCSVVRDRPRVDASSGTRLSDDECPPTSSRLDILPQRSHPNCFSKEGRVAPFGHATRGRSFCGACWFLLCTVRRCDAASMGLSRPYYRDIDTWNATEPLLAQCVPWAASG